MSGDGPMIMSSDIENNIKSEHYFTAANGVLGQQMTETGEFELTLKDHGPLELLTICVLVLQNGFTVVGTSACVSIKNFNKEIGRKIAREKAVGQIWPLMGYELKNQLAKEARIETAFAGVND